MKEKIIVVDDEDNILGSEFREKVDEKKLRYRVSSLWITNSDNKILLARRAYTKKHSPGKWGPAVAGTVEEGESYEQNIRKEADEELGLKDIKIKKGTKIKFDGEHKRFTQFFTSVLDKDAENFKIQESEVAEVRWFEKEKIEEKMKKNPEEFISSMAEIVKIFLG